LGVDILQPEDCRAGGDVDQVVAILGGQAAHVTLSHGLGRGDADDAEPVCTDLHEPAQRIRPAEQALARRLAEHTKSRGAGGLLVREEAARRDPQSCHRLVDGLDAVHDRHLAGWLRHHLVRREPLARRGQFEARHRRPDGPQILKREPRRLLPYFLERLEVGRLARFDDHVADAKAFDEGEHLRLRAGAD
jgi:hypothetical protein